jgi:hypothetical protein
MDDQERHRGEEQLWSSESTGSSEADAPSTPVRVCPSCSAQSTTDGSYCGYCGASFIRRGPRLSRRRKRVILGAVAAIIALGAAAGAAAKVSHDHQLAKQQKATAIRLAAAKERARQRAEAAAEARRRADEERQRQDAMDAVERGYRKDLEHELRKEITKSARKAVDEGLLDGPILRTSCDPIAGGSDNLDEPTGRYECLAVNTDNDDGTSEGYRYTGTINYEKGSYTWRLGGS